MKAVKCPAAFAKAHVFTMDRRRISGHRAKNTSENFFVVRVA